MNVTTFTKPKGVITLVFSAVFIIDPNLVFQFFGLQMDEAAIAMSRVLGGAYLGSGIGLWGINSAKDITTQSAILYAIGEFIAAAAFFIVMLNDVMNPLGWLFVIAYAFFGVMFVFVAGETKKAAPKLA